MVNEEPPVRTKARRLGKLRWWLLALFLAWGGYAAWREYDYRAAVREAQAAGFEWVNIGPWDLIREDWHNALEKETWRTYERRLELGSADSFTQYRDLIRRLRPTDIAAGSLKDENLDALKDAADMKELYLQICPFLQNLDALRGLTGLQNLYLGHCPDLRNVEGLRGLTGLQTLNLGFCPNLQNVDALKSLTGLRELVLRFCEEIPANSLRELRAALPNTQIIFPDRSNAPPK